MYLESLWLLLLPKSKTRAEDLHVHDTQHTHPYIYRQWLKVLEVDSDEDEVDPLVEDDEVPDEAQRRTRRRSGEFDCSVSLAIPRKACDEH
jgi:hypothetical protein